MNNLYIIGVVVIAIFLGVLLGTILIGGFNSLEIKWEWVCGEKVVGIQNQCDDGYLGCSRIYILENGGVSTFLDGQSKQNEYGQLCVKGHSKEKSGEDTKK